jgi:hypothetical protein
MSQYFGDRKGDEMRVTEIRNAYAVGIEKHQRTRPVTRLKRK